MGNMFLSFLWMLLFLCCLAVSFYAFNFAATVAYSDHIYFAEKVLDSPIRYYAHFILGSMTLTIGCLQFSSVIRNRFPNIHKYLGRIYLVCVLIGGIAGIIMSFNSIAGLKSGIGFFLLGVLWLYTGYKGVNEILKGNVEQHRRWMIRNFSLTLSAVTLRIYLGVALGVFQADFEIAYTFIAYAAWIPNLVLAEIIFNRKTTANNHCQPMHI